MTFPVRVSGSEPRKRGVVMIGIQNRTRPAAFLQTKRRNTRTAPCWITTNTAQSDILALFLQPELAKKFSHVRTSVKLIEILHLNPCGLSGVARQHIGVLIAEEFVC
jgi:hypothetical protein